MLNLIIYRANLNYMFINKVLINLQTTISTMDGRLTQWLLELPTVFNWTRPQKDKTYGRERLLLGLQFLNLQMLINRPGLCRVDERIPNESKSSIEANSKFASACLDAARATVRLLPDEPNVIGLFNYGPWWSALHFFCSATSVFLIELAYGNLHAPNDSGEILDDAKKAVKWIQAMTEGSLAVKRAWQSMNLILSLVAPRVGGDTRDMPQHPLGEDGGLSMKSQGHINQTDGMEVQSIDGVDGHRHTAQQALLQHFPGSFGGVEQGSGYATYDTVMDGTDGTPHQDYHGVSEQNHQIYDQFGMRLPSGTGWEGNAHMYGGQRWQMVEGHAEVPRDYTELSGAPAKSPPPQSRPNQGTDRYYQG
jgi:hypothetical protein